MIYAAGSARTFLRRLPCTAPVSACANTDLIVSFSLLLASLSGLFLLLLFIVYAGMMWRGQTGGAAARGIM